MGSIWDDVARSGRCAGVGPPTPPLLQGAAGILKVDDAPFDFLDPGSLLEGRSSITLDLIGQEAITLRSHSLKFLRQVAEAPL